MHILIGLITAVAGLFWALNALQRSGFNPGSLNPFLFFRRNKWKKQYALNPLHNLDKPIDIAAILLLGVLKCEGEISSEQKNSLISIFENHFKLGNSAASGLLVSSSHLLRNEVYLVDDLDNVLERSRNQFTDEQIVSLLLMMKQVSVLESPANDAQKKLINISENYFDKTSKPSGEWG